MISVKTKEKKAFESLKDTLGIVNRMETPKCLKVVVSTGTGSVTDKNKIELIQDRLQKITGQHVVGRGAKKSIASFKLRQGQIIGYQVTLRGERMYDFLDRLINVALPRTRDFRGVSKKSVDPMGNLSIGIKEHTIFPETADEEIKDVFGLSVTLVTSAKTKKDAEAYLMYIGIPFKKAEETKKR